MPNPKTTMTFAFWMVVSWVVMCVTHEIGHIIGGFIGGAELTDFDLAPWRLPYSIHQPDPVPRLTLWSGPIFGVVAPLVIASVLRYRWAWLVADFCVLANGSYLALAWVSGDPLLDTPRMLSAGVSPWTIGLYCLVTIAAGYVLFRRDCIRFFESASNASKPDGTDAPPKPSSQIS
ncbi:hypothetical protein K227x_25150 [Rubripirellula lacrimiformis]|uniref:Uncharacterized protein n=1 Tax=Rubripirellula lacrimiformis TaxID=1930273 RepID=A0A517NAG5_9BACT|nr:hypothetical protein [Rubripirellula lacrimiformis]QDT04127.1 hypothetical protein K227x_25150 [Rubripirellula lacrimiformis]